MEAKEAGLAVNVGIHEADRERIKNTLLWIDDKGDIVSSYRKLHLFDVDIPGGPVLTESRYGKSV